MPEPTPCQSCGAPMFFARTANGYRMPLDAEPVPDGNVVLIDGVAHVRKEGDGPRYKSHFATCPKASLHRKTK